MKRKLIFVLAIALAFSVLAPSACADTTLGDIAYAEYVNNCQEDPANSDCIKYNEWYYGGRVSNPYDHGEYVQVYDWNATFVTWCAEQLGYVTFSRVPRSNSAWGMYMWFQDYGYTFQRPWTAIDSAGNLMIEPGDLIFFTDTSGLQRVGIVMFADYEGVSYIVGDDNGKIGTYRTAYSALERDVSFVHIPPLDNDNLTSIVLFLQQEMHLNPAAVCGIATNIMCESEANTAWIGDDGYSGGICQWHDERFVEMIKFCDSNGYDWFSLEGQLRYLQYELEGPYRDLLEMINTSENSPDGAYEAAYLFCMDFEKPEETPKKANIRGNMAHDLYYPLWFN